MITATQNLIPSSLKVKKKRKLNNTVKGYKGYVVMEFTV
jgi:hypothetical protein